MVSVVHCQVRLEVMDVTVVLEVLVASVVLLAYLWEAMVVRVVSEHLQNPACTMVSAGSCLLSGEVLTTWDWPSPCRQRPERLWSV